MAIDLKSPIAKMPFGDRKGTVIWKLDLPYLNWLQTKADVTQDTQDTVKDAYTMGLRENLGRWAVMRKSKTVKWKVRFVATYNTEGAAKAHCVDEFDFTYKIDSNEID